MVEKYLETSAIFKWEIISNICTNLLFLLKNSKNYNFSRAPAPGHGKGEGTVCEMKCWGEIKSGVWTIDCLDGSPGTTALGQSRYIYLSSLECLCRHCSCGVQAWCTCTCWASPSPTSACWWLPSPRCTTTPAASTQTHTPRPSTRHSSSVLTVDTLNKPQIILTQAFFNYCT